VLPFGVHRPHIDPSAFLAPGVWIIGEVTIEREASIWFGAVIRGDGGPIVIGPETLVEDNVVMHGQVTTGQGCVVGHGAVVHGCVIGDRAVIGSQAVAFNATIGEGSIIAIGSVVYPGTVVPPSTIFRNGAGANEPRMEPVADRLKAWDAGFYRKLVATYRNARPRGQGRARRD
jgi:carbonic anhydrase/acetyltransferase-like protein (isoleucine patch superfamily)